MSSIMILRITVLRLLFEDKIYFISFQIHFPRLVTRALAYDPLKNIDLTFHPLSLTSQEFNLVFITY
jgi:hypothetical protein